jgi:tetratricopeptide (TPR) repeat protein
MKASLQRWQGKGKAMPISDSHGNPVTAANLSSVELLDRTVSAYLGFRKDTGDRLKETLAAEPDLMMAHCLRGYFMMLFGQRAMVARAERSLQEARRAATAGTTEREAAHLAALATWVAGDLTGATAKWEAIIGVWPHDLLALKLSQYGNFYTGESERMHQVVARALPAWHSGMPDYGFVLGCHAFGLEETGAYAEAEHAGREAIEENPSDIWAAHAVQHVFEMTGRPRDGIAWTEELEGNWRECNNFAYHPLWHRCLFLLELGDTERVLDLYDRQVRPESTDDLLDISNAVSLLWRLEQAGVNVGARWEELADRSQAHLDDHLLVFGDMHYLMALAAAGRSEGASGLLESLSRYAASSRESQALVAKEPGLAVAQAILAARRGDYTAAMRELAAVRGKIWRIGGSHAQRDLFEEMLIDSALRAGDPETAETLLRERVEKWPRNLWGWRHLAQALDAIGKHKAATDARGKAAALA